MSQGISIGMCINPDKVAELAPGYDYLELTISGALNPLEDDATYAPKGAQYAALKPPVRACNVFVNPQVKLVGPSVNWEQVELYVTRAVERAAALGVKIIVFGSGGARQVPEGYSRALAWGQLVRFLNLCADKCAGRGVTIAIEPLNKRESNILNTYLESVQMAKDVARPEVRVLADIYHFMMDGEPLDDIAQAPDWLAHVHLADSGRLHPGSGTYPLARWFAILKEIGYDGMASVECSWKGDYTQETAQALHFLRRLAE